MSKRFVYRRRAKVNGDGIKKYVVKRWEHFGFSTFSFVCDRIGRTVNATHRLWRTSRKQARYSQIYAFCPRAPGEG